MKLKKYYLIFLVLYLVALVLAGATRLGPYPRSGAPLPNNVLTKLLAYIWSLAPSQNALWFRNSGIVLVILIVLGFVAGCKLIAYFMHKGPAEGVK